MITIPQAALATKLARYASIANNLCVSTLAAVRLTAGNGVTTITGTDMDQWLTTSCPEGEVHNPLDAVIPFKPFLTTIKATPKGSMIRIEHANNKLTITAARSVSTIATIDVADFPSRDPGAPMFALSYKDRDAATLLGAMAKCKPHASDESTRPYLKGVFLHPTASGEWRAVALDGATFCITSAPATPVTGSPSGEIIPTIALDWLAKHAAKATELDLSVARTSSTTWATFVAGDFIYTTKTVLGTFPDYHRFIPSQAQPQLYFDKKALLDAAAILNRGNKYSAAMKLDVDGERCLIAQVRGGETSTHRFTPKHTYDHLADAPFVESYNPTLLMKCLRSLTGDTVKISRAKKGDPTVLSSPTDPETTVLLMPMRG